MYYLEIKSVGKIVIIPTLMPSAKSGFAWETSKTYASADDDGLAMSFEE